MDEHTPSWRLALVFLGYLAGAAATFAGYLKVSPEALRNLKDPIWWDDGGRTIVWLGALGVLFLAALGTWQYERRQKSPRRPSAN